MRATIRRLCSAISQLRDWQLFLLVHCIFVGAIMAPLLLGTHLFTGLEFTYPLFHLYTPKTLLSGAALFNRLNINGFPTFVSTDFYFANPFTYLFTALLPKFTDMHWYIFTNMVAGGLLCSLLLRKLGFSKGGSVTGGASYITGTWILVITSPFIHFVPMLPLIGFVLLLSRERPVKAAILGAVLCIYLWWAVFLQMTMMIFAAFGFGAAFMSWQKRAEGKIALRPTIVAVTGVITGTILAIPKILILLTFGALSWRASGIVPAEATGQGILPLTLVRYLFPYANFPFLNFGGDLLMLYVGTFGFVFLFTAVAVCWRKPSEYTSGYWIFAYILLFGIAIQHSPLAKIIHSFPPFVYFRGAGRWMLLGNFAAAGIVASGFDALVGGKADGIRKKLAAGSALLSSALCLGFVVVQSLLMFFPEMLIRLFQQYFAHFRNSLHLSQPIAYYETFVQQRIHELAASPFFLEPRTLFPLLSLILLAVILQERIWRKISKKSWLLVLFSLLTSASTLFWYYDYVPRADLPAKIQTVEFLKDHPGLAVGILQEDEKQAQFSKHKPAISDSIEWDLEHLVPNTNLLSGIPILDYFDNLASRRPSVLASWVGANWAGEQWITGPDLYRIAQGKGTLDEKLRLFVKRKDVMDILGLKYIVSSVPLPDQRFKKVFETRITSKNLPVAIYENPNARPLAYFSDTVKTMKENEQEALKQMLEEKWPNRKTLLECQPDCNLEHPDGKGTIDIVNDEGPTLILKTLTDRPEWLIVNINRLPGWTLTIDDQPASSVYANGTFFGIQIPKGTHTVMLHFSLQTLILESLKELIAKTQP